MNYSKLDILACTLAVVSLLALWPTEAGAQVKTAAAMGQAATAFLASLTPEQRAKAVMSFDHEERFVWQESPGVRSGVVLRELNDAQKKLAMDLLRTGVGDGGYRRIQMSMAREPVLSALQKAPSGAVISRASQSASSRATRPASALPVRACSAA